jgi:hypothetical protein
MKTEGVVKLPEQTRTSKAKDKLYDPRNEADFDTWNVGLEPIPFDETWKYCETRVLA